jgi:hypothetical protein
MRRKSNVKIKIEIKDYLPRKKWTRSMRYSAKEKGKRSGSSAAFVSAAVSASTMYIIGLIQWLIYLMANIIGEKTHPIPDSHFSLCMRRNLFCCAILMGCRILAVTAGIEVAPSLLSDGERVIHPKSFSNFSKLMMDF